MAKQTQTKRRLGWYSPRGCFKKMIKGKVHYFRGDNSKENTQANYETLLQYGAVVKESADKPKILQIENDIRKQLADIQSTYGRGIAKAQGTDNQEAISKALQDYLTKQEARYTAGQITAQSFDQMQYCLDKVLFPEMVNELTAEALENISLQILAHKNGWTQFAIAKTVKAFINWLWESERLDNLPRNFKKALQVQTPKKNKVYFELEHLQALLNLKMTDRQRLYFLLMVNCGFRYEDISNLKQEDFKDGYIELDRKKTGIHGKWKLFAETEKLLKQEKSNSKKQNDLLLLNRNNEPLSTIRIVDGKKTGRNNVCMTIRNRLFNRADTKALFESWGLERNTPTMLRDSVAQLINLDHGSEQAKMYLAHSGKGITEKHYTSRDFSLLDTALGMLGSKLFSNSLSIVTNSDSIHF